MKKQKYLLLLISLCLSAFLVICADYEDPDQYDLDKGAENNMLIITTSKYEKALYKYIEWKKERGFDVELDAVSAEKGTDAVQRKLQKKYDTEGLKYIILVGDIDDVPSVMLPAYRSSPYREDGYPSDPSYTLLEGDDLIGDALISRISVNTIPELENQLNKIIKYEKGDFENFDWIGNAVIASMTGFDGVDHNPRCRMQYRQFLDHKWRLSCRGFYEGRNG